MREKLPPTKTVGITNDEGDFTLRIRGVYFSERVPVKIDGKWKRIEVYHVHRANIIIINDGEYIDGGDFNYYTEIWKLNRTEEGWVAGKWAESAMCRDCPDAWERGEALNVTELSGVFAAAPGQLRCFNMSTFRGSPELDIISRPFACQDVYCVTGSAPLAGTGQMNARR